MAAFSVSKGLPEPVGAAALSVEVVAVAASSAKSPLVGEARFETMPTKSPEGEVDGSSDGAPPVCVVSGHGR